MQTKKFLLLLFILTLSHVVTGQIDKEAVNQMFARLSKAIEEIDPEQVEQIPYYSIQIAGIHKDMDSLQLILQKTPFQPIAPEGRKYVTFSELSGYFNHLERVITEKMSSIELIFYEGALESLSERDSLTAEKRLRLSIQYNPAYSPSLYSLVRLLISKQRTPEAEEILLKALSKVDTANNIYYASLWKRASYEVFSGYLRMADHFMRNDDYLSAIQQTSLAETLSKSVAVPGGNDSIEAYYSFAHDGMFLGYLRIAQRAIDNQKWDLASIYLEKTALYQREHPVYIRSGNLLTEANDRLEKQHLLHLKAKDENLQKTKFRQSSKYRKTKRKTVYPNKKQIKPSILPAIPEIRKDSIIRMDTAARDTALELIHAAYFLVWKNQLDTARQILARSKNDALRYHFEKDPEFQNAGNELEKRIRERFCFSVHSDFDNQVNKASTQIKRKNYSEAADAILKARQVYSNRGECSLSDSLLTELETRYKPVIHFAELTTKRSTLVIRGEYAAACAVSRAMERFVKAHPDQDILLSWQNTGDFVKKLADQTLTKAFLQASIDSAAVDDCIVLMTVYKEQNGDNKTIRDEQTRAGRLWAEYVFQQHPQENPETSLETLKLSEKWYKFFKTEYLRRFKELRKAVR